MSAKEGLGYFELKKYKPWFDEGCLCGIVVTVPGYKFRGPGSISGTIRFSEKYRVRQANFL
jgi:hypothetical protein